MKNGKTRQFQPKLSKNGYSFANLTSDVSNKNDCRLEKILRQKILLRTFLENPIGLGDIRI